MIILKPRTTDLGEFQVQRLLPAFPTRMVGPFIFFDHMGPADFAPGQGIDVRPHPHIGLATVTYLFEGAMIHRDSLGSVQRIEPGDVNWMTAGRGIVHSERTAPEDRATGYRAHGLQTWVALPKSAEQGDPSFSHHPKSSLPTRALPGVNMRLLAGTAWGQRSPAPTFSPMFYLDVAMDKDARFELPPEHAERGVYVVSGDVRIDEESVPPLHLAVLMPGATATISATTPAQIALLGGAKMDGDRFVSWNFVASSKELIEQARLRWRDRQFPGVPGETDFIPLPEK